MHQFLVHIDRFSIVIWLRSKDHRASQQYRDALFVPRQGRLTGHTHGSGLHDGVLRLYPHDKCPLCEVAGLGWAVPSFESATACRLLQTATMLFI